MARGSKNTATGFADVAETNKGNNQSTNVETNESNKQETNLTTNEENNVSKNEGSLQANKEETKVQRKRVSFDIRVDLHKRLKVQSANLERNIYELIEEAIEKHLNKLDNLGHDREAD